MTSPSTPPDLSKLRINRDQPSRPLQRALRRNLLLGLVALIIVAGLFLFLRGGTALPVQTVVATAISGSGQSGAAGSASVTANGYVVARTRASVSAKLAGRIAELRVSEGSNVRKGEVIARLESEDYQAQVNQALAALISARADLAEAQASRDVAAREAERLRGMRAKNP